MQAAQNKYEVEDDLDVDFFAALKNLQIQPKTSDSDQNDDDANKCLITYEPLNAFHVVLACGHKFNHEPLYQEVIRQKGRHGIHTYWEKIGHNQIKCPYCRSMTNQLLPYIGNTPHPIIKRLIGINAPASLCMPGVPCSAVKCNANAFYQHENKLYCYRHHQSAINKSNKLSSQISAGAAAAATAATAATAETTPNTKRCIAQNQTGKNKGKQCTLNASHGSMLCKIHSKCNMVVSMGSIEMV